MVVIPPFPPFKEVELLDDVANLTTTLLNVKCWSRVLVSVMWAIGIGAESFPVHDLGIHEFLSAYSAVLAFGQSSSKCSSSMMLEEKVFTVRAVANHHTSIVISRPERDGVNAGMLT